MHFSSIKKKCKLKGEFFWICSNEIFLHKPKIRVPVFDTGVLGECGNSIRRWQPAVCERVTKDL